MVCIEHSKDALLVSFYFSDPHWQTAWCPHVQYFWLPCWLPRLSPITANLTLDPISPSTTLTMDPISPSATLTLDQISPSPTLTMDTISPSTTLTLDPISPSTTLTLDPISPSTERLFGHSRLTSARRTVVLGKKQRSDKIGETLKSTKRCFKNQRQAG